MTVLHRAAKQGRKERVEQLLEAGASVEARTQSHGQTPLHLAAAAGHADLIPLLITPSTMDAQDDSNQTALQLAVRGRQLEAASALVAAGASCRAAQFADTPLRLVFKGLYFKPSAEMALLLLNAMLADPSSAGLVAEALQWGWGGDGTLLHCAAAHGSQELVAKLVEAGADRDAVDKLQATPLWHAAASGHAGLVPLLATPRNINLPAEGEGRTPLNIAAERRGDDVVAALLAAGALVDVQDRSGHSLLYWPAFLGRTSVVGLLLTALDRECRQQQQQQQQQHWSSAQQQGQAHGQPPRPGHPRLVELVAAVLASLSSDTKDAVHGSRLLGVVLDVLGPEVAGQVCHAAQQLLRQELDRPSGRQSWPRPSPLTLLAEALLLGWVEAEEKLYRWQPLVARLQRLVPGVLGARQQQVVHQGQKQKPAQPQGRKQVDKQLLQLAKQAALAAASGQQQEALRLLGGFAALHLKQAQQQDAQLQQQQQRGLPMAPNERLKQGVRLLSTVSLQGRVVRQAAEACVAYGSWAGPQAELGAASLQPPGLYTTLLAAWTEARRRLQQLPQEVVTTVVAAVNAAQQQQQQHVSALQEGAGPSGVPQVEHLSALLPSTLQEAGGAAAGTAGG
jgi:ankyrin repeat protein